MSTEKKYFSLSLKPIITFVIILIIIAMASLIYSNVHGQLIEKYSSSNTNNARQKNLYVAVARGYVDVEGGIIQLASNRDGVIRDVLVEEGAKVKQGQILATLDSRRAQLDMQLAQKELDQFKRGAAMQQMRLEFAQREETRLARLVLKGAISTIQLDKAHDDTLLLDKELSILRGMIDGQKVKLDLAKLDVDHMSIKAPSNGLVIRRYAKPGQGVSTLNVTPLFWFVPDMSYNIRFELEERFINSVKPNMIAEVFIEGSPLPLKAKVKRIGSLFGPKRNLVEDPVERHDVRVLECTLEPINPNNNLVLGQRVLVKIQDSNNN